MAKARVTGIGSYLPERVLTNQDLEKMVETTDEWIVTRTGMKERRIARADEYTSDLATAAGKKALERAGITPEQVDLIIVSTVTPDYITPNTASIVQYKLGAARAAAFSLELACTGLVAGLSIAKAYIESGTYHHVLVIAADKLSSITDYTDKKTCVLFGDGAAALLVSGSGLGLFLHGVTLGSDGEQSSLLMVPAGGSHEPVSEESVRLRRHYLRMEGQEVFKHAVRRMEAACQASLDAAGLTPQDISWLVPHQANLRITEGLGKRFDIDPAKVVSTLHRYGNTSASGMGIALDELLQEKSLRPGENILMVAFGGGFAWGACTLTQGS